MNDSQPEGLASLPFHHVDVFATRPYSGNSLAVFPAAAGLSAAQMGLITREMRHFESIFLQPGDGDHDWHARVFDLSEELDFAGHPLIGAACVLHSLQGTSGGEQWLIRTPARRAEIRTERRGPARFEAVLDQGIAEFLAGPGLPARADIASWFSLVEADLDPVLAPQVISTGLRYLVLPVRGDALPRARIKVTDLGVRLAHLGAQFAYLLDARGIEARHWSNDGLIEDVATGSGAGCAAAYLRRHGLLGDGETARLRQGRLAGRPSEIAIRAHGTGPAIRSVEVGGEVVLLGEGRLHALPA
jgi:trans-2,3-dihydro-3-hydroxyanthranilate isomerase